MSRALETNRYSVPASFANRPVSLCAVELALEDGVATKTHVLNLLHRLTDNKSTTAVIDAPQALVLAQEPRADIGR